MTALGKTLTIFVFIFSLAWFWLTMNAFVTRANWQTQAKAYQKQSEDAVARAKEIDAAFKELQQSKDKQIATLTDSVAKTRKELDTANAAIAAAKKDFENAAAQTKVAEENSIKLNANLDANNKQLNNKINDNNKLETAVVDSKRSEESAKNEALSKKLEADAIKTKNEQLETQLLTLQQMARDAAAGGSRFANSVPVPSNIRASVVKYESGFISISLGADAGLVKGALLDISRLSPATKYIGQIKLLEVGPKEAVGEFIPPANAARPTGDNLPKANDTVSVISR